MKYTVKYLWKPHDSSNLFTGDIINFHICAANIQFALIKN